jgi:hypothetical protein
MLGKPSTIVGKANGAGLMKQRRPDPSSIGYWPTLGAIGCARTLGFAICLLVGSISCWAGYVVDSRIEKSTGTNYYTWTVYNEDQSWGLDGFAIEVPVQTRLLAHTIPTPHSNPDRTAYWIMEERYEAEVDPHDGRVSIPAPRPGMKLLLWWGEQSPSVYPPGTTVTFSIATAASVHAGVVTGSAVTYTPQNNPHYYVSWRGQMLGPASDAADAMPASLTGNDAKAAFPAVRTVLVTNLDSVTKSKSATLGTLLPAASIAMHAGITVEGVVGSHYGIQYNTDLTDPNGWRGLANIILSTPKQIWYDPQPAVRPQAYYRIVPGPVSIP